MSDVQSSNDTKLDVTPVQEFLTEAFEWYRKISRRRVVTDNAFAKYLGVQPPAFNHWINDNRDISVVSAIILSMGLAKLDEAIINFKPRQGEETVEDEAYREQLRKDPNRRFQWRIFDVLGMPRVYVARNSEQEALMLHWDFLDPSTQETIHQAVLPYTGGKGGNSQNGDGQRGQQRTSIKGRKPLYPR